MGILNVTPDSFSDGGKFLALDAAIAHGLEILDRGAHILDIGAESTRPSATGLSPTEEQARLLPVLEAIRTARPSAILSVDTYHGSTARTAIDAGAEIINDVSGLLWDPSMVLTLADGSPPPGLVLMHTRGTPSEWHTLPRLEPATVEPLVHRELSACLQTATRAGIPLNRIVLDPGFGFGKLGHENYPLLARVASLHSLGRPILVGLSRKGFLAHALSATHVGNSFTNSPPPVARRLHATIAANTAAILAGVHIIRVHDVAAAIEASCVADAILATL
ncbi:MAG: hypothetical protein NVSMB3_11940 [Acidobacteriaceae bacterium]